MMVPAEHRSARRRRNVLLRARALGLGVSARVGVVRCSARAPVVGFGARARARVGVGLDSRRKHAQVLSIALGHRDDLRADRHELSVGLLRALAAARTHGERDLIRGAPFISGPAEDVARHQHQGGVVVERGAAVALELVHGLPEQAQGFRGDLEAKHVTSCLGACWRAGPRAARLACDERFELVHGLAASDLEPLVLRLGDGHARELANGRPSERPGLERDASGGQLFERLGDAQLLLGRARLISKQPLDVFAEACRSRGERAPRNATRRATSDLLRHRPQHALARGATTPRAPAPTRSRCCWERTAPSSCVSMPITNMLIFRLRIDWLCDFRGVRSLAHSNAGREARVRGA